MLPLRDRRRIRSLLLSVRISTFSIVDVPLLLRPLFALPTGRSRRAISLPLLPPTMHTQSVGIDRGMAHESPTLKGIAIPSRANSLALRGDKQRTFSWWFFRHPEKNEKAHKHKNKIASNAGKTDKTKYFPDRPSQRKELPTLKDCPNAKIVNTKTRLSHS